MSRISGDMLLWRKKRADYQEPHFAQCDTLLNPSHVDPLSFGQHLSIVIARGVRTYMFEGQKSRDKFVNQYRQWGAKPCKDPVP